MKDNIPENPKLALTVNECCAVLGIKRSTFYKLKDTNQIVVFKVRGRRLADARSVRALIERAIQLEDAESSSW